MSDPPPAEGFHRPIFRALLERLHQPSRFLQVLAGPRQTGKTTLARQAMERFGDSAHYASADEPGLRGPGWIEAQWETARQLRRRGEKRGALLVLDEIHKLPSWSGTLKRLWDAESRDRDRLHVLILGSSELVVRRGMAESLAGRFEVLRSPHWSYSEMQTAFGWSLDRYLFFGGYPGAAPLVTDFPRWRQYILQALVEPTLSLDILLLSRINKPALLRQLFQLGCEYSGQIVSYQKLLGQLADAGNTTTLAHYLELLSGAGLLTGLEKYSGSRLRSRASSPKLLALNPALMTAMTGLSPEESQADRSYWGRVVETGVGAHLVNSGLGSGPTVRYWRERGKEVDYVLAGGGKVLGIEVKAGVRPRPLSGLDAFGLTYPRARKLLVGEGGLSLEVALRASAAELLQGGADSEKAG